MTVEVRIHENPKGVEFFCTDVIDGGQILESKRKVLTPLLLSEMTYKIVDLSSIRENFITLEELEELAALDLECSIINPNFVTVIISPKETLTVLSDVYIEMLSEGNNPVKVVPDRKSADEWLLKMRPPLT